MKKTIKFGLGSAIMIAAFAASAIQQDITVNADIDPTVSLTLANGQQLPESINMAYMAGKGLAPYKNNVKIWSNAVDKNLNVSLVSEPKLTDETDSNPIPLTVSLNGLELTTTTQVLNYNSIFPNGIANGSTALPFSVNQKTPGKIDVAGHYSGVVSLLVAQATTTTAS